MNISNTNGNDLNVKGSTCSVDSKSVNHRTMVGEKQHRNIKEIITED